MSGINAPSSTGGVTPLRLPALTLRGYLHVVQEGSAFFPRAFGLVRRVVLFSSATFPRGQMCTRYAGRHHTNRAGSGLLGPRTMERAPSWYATWRPDSAIHVIA